LACEFLSLFVVPTKSSSDLLWVKPEQKNNKKKEEVQKIHLSERTKDFSRSGETPGK
jgi:hypothetical protein